ncbi:MAG: twitch domain-containing radical SAM protein [Bacteroidales bacterium]
MRFVISKSIRATNNLRKYFYRNRNISPQSVDKILLKNFNSQRPLGPMPKICYAPWQNLFFNTNGEAIMCCKNTKIVLGKYPQSSIREIWFSPKKELLQNAINNNDLSKGCFKCYDAIKQNSISSMTSVFYDKYGLLPQTKYPRVLEFELSNRCNLECMMCSERVSSSIAKQKDESYKHQEIYDEEFVSQLDEFIPHLWEAKFFGGEPFLIDIYYKIWDKIIEKKPRTKIVVQTNATVLSDKIKSLIQKGNFVLSVSLDSVNKENYERIRKNASFEKTIENIHWFGKRQKDLGVIATPFRENWQDIPDIVRFCNEHEYHLNFSTVYYPTNLAFWTWDTDSLKKVLDLYKSVELPQKNNAQRKNRNSFLELISTIENWHESKLKNENFNEEFLGYISHQQLQIDDEIGLKVSGKIIADAKEKFFKNAENLNRNEFKKLIDKFQPETFPLPVDVIYLELINIDINTIVDVIDKSDEVEISQRLRNIFKKAATKYIYEE